MACCKFQSYWSNLTWAGLIHWRKEVWWPHIPVAEEILQQNGWGPAREFGNLGNLGSKKIPKIKILKIKICVAQNVGKVWISRKNTSWTHLGPFQANFPIDQKMQENTDKTSLKADREAWGGGCNGVLLVPFGFTLFDLVSLGLALFRLVPLGPTWFHLDLLAF